MWRPRWLIALWLIASSWVSQAQDLSLPANVSSDPAALADAIPDLARRALAQIPADDTSRLEQRFQFQLAAGRYEEALSTRASLVKQQTNPTQGNFDTGLRFELYARAKAREAHDRISFDQALAKEFASAFAGLSDRAAFDAEWALTTSPFPFEQTLQRSLEQMKGKSQITFAEAFAVIAPYNSMLTARAYAPTITALFDADNAKRFVIDDLLVKTKQRASLATMVVRKKNDGSRLPAVLYFTIYSQPEFNIRFAKEAAMRGYVGVVADARGKRGSPDAIVPWEVEVDDTTGVIDWISRQRWSDGQVGMLGLSYGGFAQWAAAKHPHPALKTIVPAGASFPGYGLPMQNNVFQNAQYPWPFYVGNNKLLDEAVYDNRAHWNGLYQKWFDSGRPYRELDAIDGTPNPVQRRQIQHPSYDAYWQAMQPWQKDFAGIDIPVLSPTGYFDDANSAAVNYLVEHYKYNKRANHYLVVGPYSHYGSAAAVKDAVARGGYAIDPVAQLNSVDLTYQWFDHVLRNAPLPPLLKDRINYQVMGANVWRHAPSIDRMAEEVLTLYPSNVRAGKRHSLSTNKPGSGAVEQSVDFADRSTQTNLYPGRAIEDSIDTSTHITYISEPFEDGVSVEGLICGQLQVAINKRDFDFTFALYEAMPDGKYFNLSYYLGRASYADDMTKRKLLTPGKPTTLPFARTPLVARQLSKGSRLALVLTVNKNAFAQVNYGTGKDVSDESVADAKEPLRVSWLNGSFIKVPLRRASPNRFSRGDTATR